MSLSSLCLLKLYFNQDNEVTNIKESAVVDLPIAIWGGSFSSLCEGRSILGGGKGDNYCTSDVNEFVRVEWTESGVWRKLPSLNTPR